MRRTLTWKAAVVGGAALGAGFGSIALAGAGSSPNPPSTVELQSIDHQLSSPGAPLSVIPAPAADLSSVGNSAASAASPASPASTNSPAIAPAPAPAPAPAQRFDSPPSPQSPPSAQVAPAPAPQPAPAPAPAPQYDSPASPASFDSPDSPDT